jgi:DNA polymerase III epsilon subunit-like protein
MPFIVVDVESDGPCPGIHSMVCFGAVVVERELRRTFYGRTRPITETWLPEALAVSGFTREQTLAFPPPEDAMAAFEAWIAEVSRPGQPVFISDNLAYDWQFVNYYFHRALGRNPFGFSGRRIGDMFAGFHRDLRYRWKHLRGTKHTHHPVDDAKGNAEALLALLEAMGLEPPA